MNLQSLKQILIIIMLLLIYTLSFAYTGNVHRYIIEQAYELIKFENEHGYEEYDEYMHHILNGSEDEDLSDWIYHYSNDNPPDFNQFLLPSEIIDIGFDLFQIFYPEEGDPFATITHFWDGDADPDHDVFFSGNYPIGIYWSFYCPNAMEKMYNYKNGPIEPYYMFLRTDFFEADDLVSSWYKIQINNLVNFSQTGECWIDNYIVPYGWEGPFHLHEGWKNQIFFEIVGRMCHLLADMDVPAHAHEDLHAPKPNNEDGDQYEGSIVENFGFMMNPDNWHWNFLNTYVEKGGLIDVSDQGDPLLYLMYTVNQIADFFASDDVDGDSNLSSHSDVLNFNADLQAMFNALDVQFPPDHPIRNAHEMTNNECAQIRDVVFPFVIRATAGLLEWFAQEHNLTQYNLQLADTLKGYFYSYTNPVPDPDEINNEISLYYITHNPANPEVRVTIEKDNGETIWDNVEVVLHSGVPREGYLPSWNFYKRLILNDQNYTGQITIQVSEDGIVTKESTVNYNPSNKPPLPILFNWPDEEKGIYPKNQYGFTNSLYYDSNYTLKINAPYNGNIDTWYKITIVWDEEDGEHTFNLNNTSYVTFENNGNVDLTIPLKDDILAPGVVAGNIRLNINDVPGSPNHPIMFYTDAFYGLIRTISYPGIISYLIKETSPPSCPTLYTGNKRENNIIPLGENQEHDCFDYTLLNNTINNPEVIEMRIVETQDNINYFDHIQLVAVGHAKDKTIGINNSNGEIFSYNPKSQIRYDTGKDSTFVLQAEETLPIYLSDFNIPQVEYIYLKLTCSLLPNRYHSGKGSIGLGTVGKDTTYNYIDVVGLHETEYTAYSEINETDINFSTGILSLTPTRDIEISEISVVLDNSGKEDFEISNCNILKAISIQDNINVLDYIRCDDDEHFIFGLNDGINLEFENPVLNNEVIDYIFISKGRYIHNQQDEVEDITYKLSNYPNPFNPDEIGTTISFSNTKPSKNTKIEIYNIKGQLVKNFDLESEQSMVIWDGKDYNGVQVANGIYFYKLSCMNKSVVKKMILLR